MQVNRLMYRSKQRGFLEMDLLLGQWAQDHVPDAEESLLAAFEVNKSRCNKGFRFLRMNLMV